MSGWWRVTAVATTAVFIGTALADWMLDLPWEFVVVAAFLAGAAICCHVANECTTRMERAISTAVAKAANDVLAGSKVERALGELDGVLNEHL